MTEGDFRTYAAERLQEDDQHHALEYMRAGAKEGKRLLSAHGAFPNMTLVQMWATDRALQSGGKGGRPRETVASRAMQPVWLAARDVDQIKRLWNDVNPDTPMPSELALEIAAARHGVKVQTLADQVRRPNSRRIDRLAAEK